MPERSLQDWVGDPPDPVAEAVRMLLEDTSRIMTVVAGIQASIRRLERRAEPRPMKSAPGEADYREAL